MLVMAAPARRGCIAAAAIRRASAAMDDSNRGLDDDETDEIGRQSGDAPPRQRSIRRTRSRAGRGAPSKQRSRNQRLQRASRGNHRAGDHHGKRHQHLGNRQRDARTPP